MGSARRLGTISNQSYIGRINRTPSSCSLGNKGDCDLRDCGLPCLGLRQLATRIDRAERWTDIVNTLGDMGFLLSGHKDRRKSRSTLDDCTTWNLSDKMG